MSRSYFELESPADLSGWTALTALVSDPFVLQAKVDATRAALGAVEQRVAASIDFLGVSARVLSPPLRSAVVDRMVPLLDPDSIWWRPAQPGPMRLTMNIPSWREASAPSFFSDVIEPVMTPLVSAYRTAFALSPKVLWGNVASALNGATVSLRDGQAFVGDVLRLGELAATALSPPPRFVRNSCCLYYRVPGVGFCSDCVRAAPVRSRSSASPRESG